MSWRLSRGVKPEACKGCPRYARGAGFCPPDGKLDNSETVIGVGRSPGPVEGRVGRPYHGGAGTLLNNLLMRAGMSRSSVCLTNVVKCAGPEPTVEEAQFCMKTYLAEELAGRKCIVTFGALPSKLLANVDKVKNERGTVHYFANIPLVITLEPAGLIWSKSEAKNIGQTRDYLPIVIKDLVKVKRIAAGRAEVKATRCLYPHPTEAQVEDELDRIEKSTDYGLDLETNYPEGDGKTITMIGLSSAPGRAITLQKGMIERYRERLARLFADPTKRMTGWNSEQFDRMRMKDNGWIFKSLGWDGMLADHLVESDMGDFRLEAAASRFLDYEPWKHLSTKDPQRNSLDVSIALEMREKLDERLGDIGCRELLFKHSMPMALLCAEAQAIGIRVNTEAMLMAKLGCLKIIERHEKTLTDNLGPTFNWRSHPQLKQLFYDVMKLPVQLHRRNRKPTTDHYALDDLIKICSAGGRFEAYKPILEAVSEVRQHDKYASTFLSGEDLHPDGRFHPSFLQHRQVTGRLSASDPNVMQLPKGLIRSMILPDFDDWVIIKTDWSQIQLRQVAWFSGCTKMLRMFDEGIDIHRQNAIRFYGYEEITKTHRSLAKNMIYGMLYGQGAKGLSIMYGVEEAYADRFIQMIWTEYPEIKRWRDGILNTIEDRNYLRNPYGRVRWLWNRNFATEAFIALPQMTEADVMFESAIEIGAHLKANFNGLARTMMWVHDEIVTTCHESVAEQVAEAQTKIMSKPREALDGLRFPVETTIGGNYDEASREEGLAGDWRRLRRTVR